MAANKSTAAEVEIRAQKFAGLLSRGATRLECCQYASEKWGVCDRTADRYLARAREIIKECWSNVQRDQMVADLLSQYASLQQQARTSGQFSVALGCINGAARLAQLVS